MRDDLPSPGHSQPAWVTWLARTLLLAVLGVVGVAVLFSSSQMAQLRSGWPWLSQMISRVERIWPAVDMVHLVMFAALGLVAALAFPAWGWRRLLVVIAVLAAVSELAQFWVPGRTATVGEAVLDVVGAVLGLAAAWVISSLAGWKHSPGGRRPGDVAL